MRSPTKYELRLIQGDIYALEKYCLSKSLINDNFKKRFDGILIQIGEEVEGMEGAAGKANSRNKTVIIRQDKIQDNMYRRHVLYHEIGHLLFGFKNLSDIDKNEIYKRITNTKLSNEQLSDVDSKQVASGIKLLEDYIVEKFAVKASHATLNRTIQREINARHVISGGYIFNTTFPGTYGIYETLCDELLEKAYGNFDNIQQSCLQSTFYKELFEKYDEIELIKILEKLGYVHDSVMSFGKDRTIRSVPKTQEALEDLRQMIHEIKSKTGHRSNSNRVTPEGMAEVTRRCMQENPGLVSEGVGRTTGWFSRLFDRNKGSQNR